MDTKQDISYSRQPRKFRLCVCVIFFPLNTKGGGSYSQSSGDGHRTDVELSRSASLCVLGVFYPVKGCFTGCRILPLKHPCQSSHSCHHFVTSWMMQGKQWAKALRYILLLTDCTITGRSCPLPVTSKRASDCIYLWRLKNESSWVCGRRDQRCRGQSRDASVSPEWPRMWDHALAPAKLRKCLQWPRKTDGLTTRMFSGMTLKPLYFWPIGLCLLSVHNPSGLTEREGTEGSTSVRKQWTLTTQV